MSNECMKVIQRINSYSFNLLLFEVKKIKLEPIKWIIHLLTMSHFIECSPLINQEVSVWVKSSIFEKYTNFVGTRHEIIVDNMLNINNDCLKIHNMKKLRNFFGTLSSSYVEKTFLGCSTKLMPSMITSIAKDRWFYGIKSLKRKTK